MIETYNDFEPPIRQLYELVNDLSDNESFINRCQKFSVLDKSMSDSNYLRFQINEEIAFLIGIDDPEQNSSRKKISCAILSVCWWETYSESDHKTRELYNEERERFESIYYKLLKLTIGQIGNPFLLNKDNDQKAYNYAIWKRESGLLILQQSSYDPQFGHDINYWLQPWEANREIKPTVPFTDWLLQNSRM